MKKRLLSIFMSTTLALTAISSAMAVSAEETAENTDTAYSINNDDYAAFVSELESFDYSKEEVMKSLGDYFLSDDYFVDTYGEGCTLKNLYYNFTNVTGYSSYVAEVETADGARAFADLSVDWSTVYYGVINNADDDTAHFEENPIDEIDEKLKSDFNSSIGERRRCFTYIDYNRGYADTNAYENIINRGVFLMNEYQLKPVLYAVGTFDNEDAKYYDDNVTVFPEKIVYAEPEDKYVSYDINNDSYRKYINSFPARLSDEFAEMMGYYHLYIRNKDSVFAYEIENNKIAYATTNITYEDGGVAKGIKYRDFNDGYITWTSLFINNARKLDNLTVENMNTYLKENNLKAEIVKESEDRYTTKYYVAYDNDVKIDDIIDVCLALDWEFGVKPEMYTQLLFKPYYDNNLTSEEFQAIEYESSEIEPSSIAPIVNDEYQEIMDKLEGKRLPDEFAEMYYLPHRIIKSNSLSCGLCMYTTDYYKDILVTAVEYVNFKSSKNYDGEIQSRSFGQKAINLSEFALVVDEENPVTKKDFELFLEENNIPATVKYFYKGENPLKIVLTYDDEATLEDKINTLLTVNRNFEMQSDNSTATDIDMLLGEYEYNTTYYDNNLTASQVAKLLAPIGKLTSKVTEDATETTTTTVVKTEGATTTRLNTQLITAPLEDIMETTTTVTTIPETEASQTVTNLTLLPVEIPKGDANGDIILNVRDCSFIALKIAQGASEELPKTADFNEDGVVNVRDAASIANYLATKYTD